MAHGVRQIHVADGTKAFACEGNPKEAILKHTVPEATAAAVAAVLADATLKEDRDTVHASCTIIHMSRAWWRHLGRMTAPTASVLVVYAQNFSRSAAQRTCTPLHSIA